MTDKLPMTKNTTRILSIDLPWTDNNFTSASFFEVTDGKITHFTNFTERLARRDPSFADKVLSKVPGDRIDYLLLDIPIGGNDFKIQGVEDFRAVEIILTNFSSFESPNWGTKIRFPTFMAGAKKFRGHEKIICEEGIVTAQNLMKKIKNQDVKVLEVFPQTAMPAIIERAQSPEICINKLAPHKKIKGGDQWLLKELTKIMHLDLESKAPLNKSKGLPDFLDSIMGALPILDELTAGAFLNLHPAWFLYNPKISVVSPTKDDKKVLLESFITGASLQDIKPGINQRGIFTYDYGWKQGLRTGLKKAS